jgi:hypothetical protein
MKRKRKPRARISSRHLLARQRGIVTTPIRLALDALVVPRRNARSWWFECPSMSEVIGRLSNGRAVQIRYWATGRRSAPAWFVAVLASELRARRDHIDRVLADLATVQTGDKRRSPEASARARALRMRQLGRPVNEGAAVGAPHSDASADPVSDTPKPE